MRIRKYLLVTVVMLLLLAVAGVSLYRQFFSRRVSPAASIVDMGDGAARLARTRGNGLEVYANGAWADFEVRGIQLSAFHPGYEKNRSGVNQNDVLTWLQTIADIGANTLLIPYLQPPAFYSALYDFNLNRDNPLYILHSIPIDAQTAMVFYNAYQPEVVDNMWADIRATVDALHGSGLLLDNSRHHNGIYLKDVSPYVLGYVLGDNTSAEVVTLTNQRFPANTSFVGDHYSVENGNAFSCFVAQSLDYIHEYELSRYGTVSLYSYISTPETDPLDHRLETNITKNASIDLEGITPISGVGQSLMVCYSAHPNSPDFTDYEDSDSPRLLEDHEQGGYMTYLKRLVQCHSLPVVITSTGIPASRGISRVDLDDGYDRGGLTEEEQGALLVRMLSEIDAAGCAGAVIQSFKDDWGLTSSFNMRDYVDSDTTSYWQDAQASDESFGLLEFVAGKDEPICTVDGDVSEWRENPLYSADGIRVSAKSDTKYLYLRIDIEDWSLTDDRTYLAMDVTGASGATRWDREDLDFPIAADFIVEFNGYNESRIVVQERYDLFRYRYAYYSYVLEKQPEMPAKDAPRFGGIFQMHRFNMLLTDTNTLAPLEYSQTGLLRHGNANPSAENYNSLTDFCKKNDVIELRIPWSLLNMRDPVGRTAMGDFYQDGLDAEIRLSSIGFAAVHRSADGNQTATGAFSYRIPNMRNMEYHSRLRNSAAILRDHWQKTG